MRAKDEGCSVVTRIILVRHGESLGNIDPNHYETTQDYALPLTDEGRLQAKHAGSEIIKLIGGKSVRAYVSPWYRTRQTFDEIAFVLGEVVIRATEDPRIREQEWGHLRNKEDTQSLVQERIEYSTFYYRLPDHG